MQLSSSGLKRNAVIFEHGCYEMCALQVAPCWLELRKRGTLINR